MRRPTVFLAVLPVVAGLLALVAVAGRGGTAHTVAGQAASPETGVDGRRRVASPGIERIGCGDPSFAGATPIAGATPDVTSGAMLEFNEVRFAPGEAIAEHLYPQPVIAYVATGMVDLDLGDFGEGGGAAKLRTLDAQNSDRHPWQCQAEQDLAPHTSVTLRAGDAVFLENVHYVISNPYHRDAVLLTAVLAGGDAFDSCRGGCPTWP